MTLYYCLILWIGLVSLFLIGLRDKYKRSQIVVILGCFGIFLIQALRSRYVGVDINGYLMGYQMVKNINVFSGERLFNYDVGYILYSQILSKLNISNQIYLAVTALIIIIPNCYIWIKNSKIPSLSIFIYITLGFFTFSFSGLRQSIAISIVFFSLKYIQEKKTIKFILFVTLATLFHFTAVIFIFAYPLYYWKLKPFNFFFILLSFIITFIFKEEIFLIIYRLFKGVPGEVVDTNAYTMLVIMIFILILAYVFDSSDNQNMNLNAYRNYMLVAIFVQIFASESNVIMRAGFYYYLFITLLIPEVLHQQNPKIKVLAISGLVLSLLYFFQLNTGSGYLDVSPYYFFWE
ncbi:EpsG family protein [Paenibacillus sp. FSL P2-0089]|uniref:EpsG family protein n=1 Tax=Paenibacillus sp. FSL P2-0089 TaxID=2954526 RepID=UPI00315A1998